MKTKKIQTYSSKTTSTLVFDEKIEFLSVDENVSAFKKTIILESDNLSSGLKKILGNLEKRSQGLVYNHEIDLLKNNLMISHIPWTLVSDVQLEKIRLFGYQNFENKSFNETSVIFDSWKSISDLKKASYSWVKFDHSSHTLFDKNDKILPVAVFFDYIHSRIYETEYNLEKLAKILLERDDVIIKDHFPNNKQEEQLHKVTKVKDAIFQIPYYNSENGQTQSIQFLWQPTPQDFERVWDECKKSASSYPSTEIQKVVFKLDLLNTAQALKIKNKKPSFVY